jgi:HNH endonuclease
MTDDWHPEVVFALDQHECRVYSDNRCLEWAVVDEVDYAWAIRWCWTIKEPKPNGRRGHSRYFCRAARDQDGVAYSVYLHVEVQRRRGITRPWDRAVVDHLDGNTFDCRRENLAWATHAMNRRKARRRYVYGEIVGES